jgi:hypothetical protein
LKIEDLLSRCAPSFLWLYSFIVHINAAGGRERPVKSKKKLCHFGVVSYERRRWTRASSQIEKETTIDP